MTMGEIATMAIGEGWAKPAKLTVVKCQNYDHTTHYELPIAPSPNLPTQHSIYLYPTTCLFEGTVLSMGRGTEAPFEVYGHPDLTGYDYTFTPHPTPARRSLRTWVSSAMAATCAPSPTRRYGTMG